MRPVAEGEEEVPKYIDESPVLLHTGEVSGHGNVLALTQAFDPATFSGETDVVLAAGGGGLNFIDVLVAGAQESNAFNVSVHIATTDEVGAGPDGNTTQINIGHAEGVAAYGNLLYLADGPHGMSVWQIADETCSPTGSVHLVANTLQSEYPVTDQNGTTILPAPHAHAVVLDTARRSALVMSQSRGMRRINVAEKGAVGEPKLLFPKETDIFEHNTDAGNPPYAGPCLRRSSEVASGIYGRRQQRSDGLRPEQRPYGPCERLRGQQHRWRHQLQAGSRTCL